MEEQQWKPTQSIDVVLIPYFERYTVQKVLKIMSISCKSTSVCRTIVYLYSVSPVNFTEVRGPSRSAHLQLTQNIYVERQFNLTNSTGLDTQCSITHCPSAARGYYT